MKRILINKLEHQEDSDSNQINLKDTDAVIIVGSCSYNKKL